MKLTRLGRSFSRLRVAAPLVALALGGCTDPFVAFEEIPTSEGGAGGSSAGTGTGAVTSGAQPSSAGSGATASGSAGSSSAGSGATGSGGTTVVTTGGSEPGAAGEPAMGEGGAPPKPPAMVLELIDDVEGAFPHLPEKQGRNGGWYTTHDDSYGQLSPANAVALQPARGASHFAAAFSGAGFTGWGAQLGVSLTSPNDGYDASAYCGVRFLAKGTGSGWTFLVSDHNSVPDGGVCDPNAWEGPGACYHFSGKSFQVAADWQEVVIRFDDLKVLLEPGNTRALDTKAIYDIIFNAHSDAGGAFQLLVDDLAFIKAGDAGCQ